MGESDADRRTAQSETRVGVNVRRGLDQLYLERPGARPSFVEVVIAEAHLTHHSAANHPDLIAAAVAALGDDACLEDVLAWADSALASSASET